MGSRHTIKLVAQVAVIFAVGAFSGYFFHNTIGEEKRGFIIREGVYKLINPILSCEIAQKGSFTELRSVESSLNRLVSKKISQQEASHISIYLRLLNSGRWIGVNEEKEYTPASLMKVIIMVAFFKEAENNPSVLTREIQFTDQNEPVEFRPDGGRVPTLQSGLFYSIDELIQRMIVESSNAAEHILLEKVDLKILEEIVRDLGLPDLSARNNDGLYFMSPMRYSLAFRVLYGATYLNREMSERALALLTSANYKDGIRKKIPPQIIVADKFGIFSKSETGPKELHDCGIVYYPDHPYLLCVMTEGSNFPDLASVIADISDMTYKELDNFYKSE